MSQEQKRPHQQPVADRLRRVREWPSEPHDPQPTSHPRANPDLEEVDVERGEGKLDRIVGN
jgi:hypothetical protein